MALNKEGLGTGFLTQGSNKRCIALDLKTPLAREAARRLIARSDVVLENFRPGVMSRFGLDYPSVGPEHAWLHETGRARYLPVTDAEAMDAFQLLCRTEGIIPAIESAHALAGALRVGRDLGTGSVVLVNLSGRGDKDMGTAIEWFGLGEARPDDDAGEPPK